MTLDFTTLEKIRAEVEGMKGLTANPDFFVRLKHLMSHNHLGRHVDRETLTQIVWTAKDEALTDLLTYLDTEIANAKV